MKYWFSGALATLLFAVTASGVGAFQLNDIVVRSGTEGTEVAFLSEGPMVAQSYLLSHPDRIVLDLQNVGLSSALVGSQSFVVNRGGVSEITTSQFTSRGPSLRIVIELQNKCPYAISQTVKGTILTLRNQPDAFGAWQASKASSIPTSQNPSTIVDRQEP